MFDGRWNPDYSWHRCCEEKKFLLRHESTPCHSKDMMMKSKVMGKRYLGRKFILFREGFIPGEELGRSQRFNPSLLF